MPFEINLSDVPEGYGGDLPAGNFHARLMASPEMTETSGNEGKAKLPMLAARFEIIEGELKGKEHVMRYVFAVEMVDGKPKYSQGTIAFKRDLKAIGEALSEGFKLTDKNAVKVYGAKFREKTVVLNAGKYKSRGWKEGQDLSTSYKVTGLANSTNGVPPGLTQLPSAAAVPAGNTGGDESFDDEEFS